MANAYTSPKVMQLRLQWNVSRRIRVISDVNS